MTRSEIIELMARAFDEHYKNLGIGPCEIAYKLANDAVRVLTAAGLAIVPIEPSETILKACEREWDGRLSFRCTGAYKAMIAAAIKEQEGRD